jgi:hypothetical protein
VDFISSLFVGNGGNVNKDGKGRILNGILKGKINL